MKILFVDDQATLRKLYQLGLARQGHRVLTADGGMAAIHAVRGQNFDIIIMDMEMPQMNGWEAIRQIRKLPYGKKSSIIIFTAQHLILPAAQIQQIGINGILNKPLTPGELLSHVSQMTRH